MVRTRRRRIFAAAGVLTLTAAFLFFVQIGVQFRGRREGLLVELILALFGVTSAGVLLFRAER